MKKIILLLLISFSGFAQIKKDTIELKVKLGAKLKPTPELSAYPILEIKDFSEKIFTTDYNNGFYKIFYKNQIGFIQEVWVNETTEIINFKTQKEIDFKKKQIETEILETEKKILEKENLQKKQKELEKRYIKKFGLTVYNKLIQGLYWIGMTKEMIIISLGTPKNINKTITKNSILEQWVYERINLYFENEILQSIQTFE